MLSKQRLHRLLEEYHSAFSLDEGERGETDLVEMEIHTGDASPRRVAARRMPLAERQEVSRHLQKMQDNGIIRLSNSPWASHIVMVKERDGPHRFCVDYRELNSVTKLNTYPLPKVDDLLDQLRESRCFSAPLTWQVGIGRLEWPLDRGTKQILWSPMDCMNSEWCRLAW